MIENAKARASDSVAARFSRMMNATTSPVGMFGDPPVVAAATAVFLLIYLAARGSDASPLMQQICLVLTAIPIGLAILVALLLLGSRGRVVSWLADQPFPIENMNAVLNGLGEGLEITFREAVPKAPELYQKLDSVHPDCFVTDEKENAVTVRIGVVDSKRNPAYTNHQRYRRVLELVERVLVPLHANAPIETVRVK